MKHISHDPNTMLFTVILNQQKKNTNHRRHRNINIYVFFFFLSNSLNLTTTKNEDSPFDLERCGPAIDLAIEVINHRYLKQHKISLQKRTER